MARDFFRIEKGIAVTTENGNTGVHILFGADLPGSLAQENNAEVGSIYQRTNGEIYYKKTAGSGTDKWVRSATTDDITALDFRSKALVVTAEVEPGELGTIDFSSAQYSDDDTPYLGASDHTLGDYILFGAGGTEVAYRVVDITGDVVTYSKDAAHATYPVQALADGDFFVVANYLPDSPNDQEGQALIQYRSAEGYIKVGDVNWDFATGINLSSNYTPGTGNVTTSDSVESALEKIDGNVDNLTATVGVAQGDLNLGVFAGTIISDNVSVKTGMGELESDLEDLQTAIGISAGATNMGTYTGTIIPDNGTAKQNIQALETDLDAIQTLTGVAAESTDLGTFTGSTIADNSDIKEALQDLETGIEGIQLATSATGVTTAVTLDSVLVDNVIGCEWLINISLDSNPAQRIMYTLLATHDGTASADASNVDESVFGKLKIGANFNYNVSVDLNGSAGTQVMRLRVSASAGITVRAIRRAINF